MRRVGVVVLGCVGLGGVAAAPSHSFDEIRSLAAVSRCEQHGPGHVIFSGDSADLGKCLDGFKLDRIDELRISSGGGSAWDTLESMRRYRGSIELLVVDKLCASSCANYVMPAAKRLRVEPGSYVLLHGSLNLRDLDRQEEQVRNMMRDAYRKAGGGSPEDIERRVTDDWNDFHAQTAAQIPVQAEFAEAVISCVDWLEPTLHEPGPLPEHMAWLLVTPEMAMRCLRTTEVVGFWPPEADEQFPRDLGFVRARR